MNTNNIILNTDSYKSSHYLQPLEWVEELGDRENLLGLVFRDGELLRDYTFDEVRGV